MSLNEGYIRFEYIHTASLHQNKQLLSLTIILSFIQYFIPPDKSLFPPTNFKQIPPKLETGENQKPPKKPTALVAATASVREVIVSAPASVPAFILMGDE